MSRFRDYLDGRRFLSLTLKDVYPHILSRKFSLRHGCWGFGPSNVCVEPFFETFFPSLQACRFYDVAKSCLTYEGSSMSRALP